MLLFFQVTCPELSLRRLCLSEITLVNCVVAYTDFIPEPITVLVTEEFRAKGIHT